MGSRASVRALLVIYRMRLDRPCPLTPRGRVASVEDQLPSFYDNTIGRWRACPYTCGEIEALERWHPASRVRAGLVCTGCDRAQPFIREHHPDAADASTDADARRNGIPIPY